ncbi:MAG TPA: DNA-formamidopyrimidine glycosylase family protein [Pirellulales bacterium]|nr:DNA-formamidopyrimidine glycosylase family protein [Pirellulales bacterium]
MPELPEVETMCRGILPLVGRQVAHVERPPCKRRPIAIRPRIDVFRRRIEGKTIVAVDRAGKRVVIWLGDRQYKARGQEAIVIEPRMTGLVLLTNPPTQEHLRFCLRLFKPASGTPTRSTGESNLLFWDRRGLGSVSLFSAVEFAAKFQGENKTLGPDALRITPAELRQRLHYSRRHIKVALLDQRAIAGIGNLYASEILHVAGIHPAARCHRLRNQQWLRLHAAMHLVLEDAIYYEGSTLSDGTYRNALNEAGGYQNHHRVYDHVGQKCPTCGRGAIQRMVQAQRSTFFCPHCQNR